ncbi:MAG: hypothetical protein Q8P01_03980 [bacterium]|nr:hypothetical protein [bacterium]
MTEHGPASLSVDQFAELAGHVVRHIPRDIPPERAQFFVQNGEELERALRNGLMPEPDVAELLRAWEEFYLAIFKRQVDFSGVAVPAHQAGFDRLIVVAGGLTPNVAFHACHDQFQTWSYYDDLDKAIVANDRELTKNYAVWVRDRVEADEELKNLSASQLKERNIQGVTLLERFLYELKFHAETGDHLDKRMTTICSGSRYLGGGVPYVYWHDGGLCVYGDHPDFRSGGLRSRQAVS